MPASAVVELDFNAPVDPRADHHGLEALDLARHVVTHVHGVNEALGRLHDAGWDVRVTAGLMHDVHAIAEREFPTLVDAERGCLAAGLPDGTIVNWLPVNTAGPRPLRLGGLALGGPRFGEGNVQEILVTDVHGQQELYPSRAAALAAVREAIRVFATEVARTYPNSDDLARDLLERAESLEDLPAGEALTERLAEDPVKNETFTVTAIPADFYRWDGFKAGVQHPDRPDFASVGHAGPVAARLALEGHERARLGLSA